MAKLKLVAEPDKHEIRMWRDFEAPRELVFKAFTDPTLVPKWWGPYEVTTTVDQMDVRKGGIWRYVQRDDSGNEYGFSGVYHEVVSPERLVFTFEFEGLPGHVLLETVTFEEHDGKTRMIDSSIFQTVEDRDGMIQSGMERGAAASWDRFEELLKTL
ncbi:MAG: SRPBCC family protein [Chloroflexi bacterium]|nr:SRPBCC family protein [Chloroflexota bacterium]